MRIFSVLNLGGGIQSSRILLGMCRGELPRPDVVVFADTGWEPEAVYTNLDFLQVQADRTGIQLVRIGVGASIRDEALQFMRTRTHAGRKRYASLPIFVQNPDGSSGRMKRQCTSEYKIKPINRWIKRELLGLAPDKRVPKDVLVRQWFGISADEQSRVSFPGIYRSQTEKVGEDLYGEPIHRTVRVWKPDRWRENVYPLLGLVTRPDRSIVDEPLLPRPEQRSDCVEWLARHYPGRAFPRSACIGCPFRSNGEWREMREQRPQEWEDACDFDEKQRQADAASASDRKLLVGVPYLHRQMVPLRVANLDGDGERGGGCGTLYDGQDGLCDV